MINKSKIVKDAQKFVAKGQLDKAIAEYRKITSASPNDTNTHNTIGDLYLKLGDKAKAIESFKTAADLLNRDGFALKAIALYKKVLNINPDQVEVLMQMGKLNAERGMLGNANEHYMAAVSYFTKQGKKDKALDVYKVLCNLNPKNITLAQKLAELYMSEGMQAEGLSKLIELAEIKAQDGELNEARQFLDRARNKGSDRHDFIMVSSLINLKDGRIPEAVSSLEHLRDLDPGDMQVRKLLCDAYVHSGRYEEAAAIAEEMMEDEPQNYDHRKKLIGIYIKSGDFGAAWGQYRDQVEIHLDKKEYNKAQKLIQDYLEHNPDSIEARQVLADMFTSIGRDDRVVELHVEMADIYTKTGETEKAYNIYNKLMELEPDNENYRTAVANLGHARTGPSVVGPEEAVEQSAPPRPFGAFEDAGEPPDAVEPFAGFEEEAEPGSFDAGLHEEDHVSGTGPDEEPPSGAEGFGMDLPAEFSEEGTAEEPVIEAPGEEGPFSEADEAPPVYDLSDMPDELPPLGLGGEADIDIFEKEEPKPGVYEIEEEDAVDMEGLDIFGSGEATPAQAVTDEKDWTESAPPEYEITEPVGGVEELGPLKELDEPAYQEASSFEESLTEADVYIKYGLYPKAAEVLSSLESTHPANPEIQLRLLDICKAMNDMDGFVERSLQLVGIYKSRNMDAEAKAVLDKAVLLSPGDERLTLYTEGAGKAAGRPVVEEEISHTQEEFRVEEAFSEFVPEPVVEAGLSPGSVGFLEELAEADFYAKQGMVDEAMGIYRRLLASDPENEAIRDKYNRMLGARQEAVEAPAAVEPEAEPAVPSESSMDSELDEAFREMDFGPESAKDGPEEPAVLKADEPVLPEPEAQPETEALAADEDEGFFDLAAELREEMGVDIIAPSVHHGTFEDSALDEVFQEFRKGVSEQLGDEDYETHYNLGIAYKEMGMIDEAIIEFDEASKDPSRALECASMLGLCHLERGEYKKAIEHFKRGLAVKGRDREEYLGLKYDMATAYELSGDPAAAFAAISDIYMQDQEFRDVRKRFQRLEKAAGPRPEDEGPSTKDVKTKKSRVSYL